MDADLQLVLEQVRTRFGNAALTRLSEAPAAASSRLPSGVVYLDQALGGGLPIGRISEIGGRGTSGAATLALRFVVSAQAYGGHVVWIDLGYAFDGEYAAAQGVALDQLVLARPALLLSSMDIVATLVAENAAALVVVDSTAEIASAPGGVSALNAALRRITPVLAKTAGAVLFLSRDGTTIPALAHAASLRLGCECIAWIDNRVGDVLGYRTCVTVAKNKLGRAGGSAELTITLDGPALLEQAA